MPENMSDGGNAMKGIVNVRVSNARISFELRLERNITILSGDSATGKTTLVGLRGGWKKQRCYRAKP